jgi:hypothetical protein
MQEVAAIAMAVNAFKTLALFNGKAEDTVATAPPSDNDAPEPPPGKT